MVINETRYVRPVDGVTVRFPDTKTPLPLDGAVVPWDSYWRRRYKDGSIAIILATPPVEDNESVKQETKSNKRRKY